LTEVTTQLVAAPGLFHQRGIAAYWKILCIFAVVRIVLTAADIRCGDAVANGTIRGQLADGAVTTVVDMWFIYGLRCLSNQIVQGDITRQVH
jgi:hypothetical protein